VILLLGHTGYIGQAFAQALQERNTPWLPLSRRDLDYTAFDALYRFLKETRPSLVINAAGYTGKPNVDACETHRSETLLGNVVLPATVAHACSALDIPCAHISSGCIYTGAKIRTANAIRVERNLLAPEIRPLWEQDPTVIHGFTENDEPNFTFRHPPCSFYSGSKALAEEAVRGVGRNYIWRLRIPFDQFDNPRNYLTKLLQYPRIYENVNSLSHRGDLVRACLDLWECRAPFGIYNVTNPGFVTTHQVVALIREILEPSRKFEFWTDDAEFYRLGAKTPRSNCVLDVSKLLATGVTIRPVEEALRDSLRHWVPLDRAAPSPNPQPSPSPATP
jgi:dTDP-4-dehydrorhamnose reductase